MPTFWAQFWPRFWKTPISADNIMQVGVIFGKPVHQIVVLKEFLNMYDKIKRDQDSNSQGSLLVGTPGIGKTTFLSYLATRLLQEGESIIIYNHKTPYVFSANGVYVPLRPDENSAFFSDQFKGVITLIDGDTSSDEVIRQIRNSTLQFYSVLASSLLEDRIKAYKKQRSPMVLVPEAPTFTEALSVWNLHFPGLVEGKERDLKKAWARYGPDFRLGQDIIRGITSVQGHHWFILSYLKGIKAPKLLEYFRNLESGREITHMIIETVASSNHRLGFCHRLRSRTIMRLLSYVIALSEFGERRQLYQALQATPQLSVSRGWLFEGLAIDTLSQEFEGKLKSISSNDGSEEPLSLPKLKLRFLDNKIQPAKTVSHSRLYVPIQSNNPTWDAFCYKGNVGIGFQIVIAGKNSLMSKAGFMILNSRFTAANVTRKMFVFVIPKDATFRVPTLPEGISQMWEFFSLEVDVSVLHPVFAEQLKHPEDDEGEDEDEDEYLPEREEEEDLSDFEYEESC
ncbi:hypothetical protein GYMLUDRAFT_90542 [Collybiopsis luxurians FD-317 M1]|nr:hypothetical protein GYMLUDRAFT_90542 [Collybiopsis luxurians FD-317 M1]